jgi:hypothetical protein
MQLHCSTVSLTKSFVMVTIIGTIVIKEPPGKYLKREILGTSGHKPPQAVRYLHFRCTPL